MMVGFSWLMSWCWERGFLLRLRWLLLRTRKFFEFYEVDYCVKIKRKRIFLL